MFTGTEYKKKRGRGKKEQARKGKNIGMDTAGNKHPMKKTTSNESTNYFISYMSGLSSLLSKAGKILSLTSSAARK